MHTRCFIRNKKPYYNYGWNNDKRKEIIEKFCAKISMLEGIKIINVVINKRNLRFDINILEKAFGYSIQRIQNHLDKIEEDRGEDSKFMIITDNGRIAPMRRISRKIQRINYIPSRYSSSSSNQPIDRLIEDPLPKNSQESYFIQVSDIVSTIIRYYMMTFLDVDDIPYRMTSRGFDYSLFSCWMDVLKPCFNTDASTSNEHGVVILSV